MKYKIKRRKKTVKVIYIIIVFVIVIILMSTAYSLWQTDLYINGTVIGEYVEPELNVDIVKPSSDRLTTNSDLTGGSFNVNVFDFEGDEIDGNTVVTKLRNDTKTWITKTIDITFSVTLQNNSGSTYADPQIQIEEYDTQDRINPTSTNVTDILSTTTVTSGSNVTVTAKISFEARYAIIGGSYINYKVSFLCNDVRRYYNYKILIV